MPRFGLRAEQLARQAHRLRKGGLVAAAQVQSVEIDGIMGVCARYVSARNPNKGDAGSNKEDHAAEGVNRDA